MQPTLTTISQTLLAKSDAGQHLQQAALISAPRPRSLTIACGLTVLFAVILTSQADAQTRLVKDLAPGGTGSTPLAWAAPTVSWEGNVYFWMKARYLQQNQLWRSNGHASGTYAILKGGDVGSFFAPVAGFAAQVHTHPTASSKLFFSRYTALWVTNGSEGTAHTHLVKNFPGTVWGPRVSFRGKLYFTINTNAGFNPWYYLYESDGTPAGTKQFLDSNGNNVRVYDLATLGDAFLLMSTSWDTLDTELYVSNGTTSGTSRLSDIAAGASSSFPRDFKVIKDKCFFSAQTNALGREAFWTDGWAVKRIGTGGDINPGTASSNPRDFVGSGDWVFFTAERQGSGRELYELNTQNYSERFIDIWPGTQSSGIKNMMAVGDSGKIVFSAYGANYIDGEELWLSDKWDHLGLPHTPVKLKEINPGSSGCDIREMIRSDSGEVFFSADNGRSLNGRQLWRTNGRPEGTTMISDYCSPCSSQYGGSGPHSLAVLGCDVIFRAYTLTTGSELFAANAGKTQSLAIVGHGCLTNGTKQPSLTAVQPSFNGLLKLSLRDIPVPSKMFFGIGLRSRSPFVFLGCEWHIDFGQPIIFLEHTAWPNGSFTKDIPLPPLPSLICTGFIMQAAMIGSGQFLGTTNGLSFYIGH